MEYLTMLDYLSAVINPYQKLLMTRLHLILSKTHLIFCPVFNNVKLLISVRSLFFCMAAFSSTSLFLSIYLTLLNN